MEPEFSLSDLADQDVLDIAVYLARFGVDVADRMVDRLNKQFETLAQFPTMRRARDDIRPGLISIVVNRYLNFNLPVDDGIRVIRVLHGSRDIDHEFEKSAGPARLVAASHRVS